MDDRELRILRERLERLEQLAEPVEDDNEAGRGAYRALWIYPTGKRIPYWQRFRIRPDGGLPTSDTDGQLITAAVLGDPNASIPFFGVQTNHIVWRYPGSASGFITLGRYPTCGACYPGTGDLHATVQYRDFNANQRTVEFTLRQQGFQWSIGDPVGSVNILPDYGLNIATAAFAFGSPEQIFLRCFSGQMEVGMLSDKIGTAGGGISTNIIDVRWPVTVDSCQPFAARVRVSEPTSWTDVATQQSGSFVLNIGRRLYVAGTPQQLLTPPSNFGSPPFGIESFTITS